MLRDVREHLGQDIGRVDDPRARALFETAREVVNGLVNTFEHYERGVEEAWPGDRGPPP